MKVNSPSSYCSFTHSLSHYVKEFLYLPDICIFMSMNSNSFPFSLSFGERTVPETVGYNVHLFVILYS